MKIRIIKWMSMIISLAIVLGVFLLISSIYNSNKTVGYVKDNQIYYNNRIFIETFEHVEFETGKCLGSVEWTEDNHKSRIYKIKNEPNCIVLSMGTDYRIYKATN